MTEKERTEIFKKIEEINKDLSFWAEQLIRCKQLNFEKEGQKTFEKLVELVKIKDRLFENLFDEQ